MPDKTPDANLYITDKTGRKRWNTHCGYGFHEGEQRNLQRHLDNLKARHPAYAKVDIDLESAKLVLEVDGTVLYDSSDRFTVADQQLLDELAESLKDLAD